MSYIVNVFKLDANNIIIHVRSGNLESTNTYNIAWSSIRSISVDGDRINIYHGHSQSLFNINGAMAIPIEDAEMTA